MPLAHPIGSAAASEDGGRTPQSAVQARTTGFPHTLFVLFFLKMQCYF